MTYNDFLQLNDSTKKVLFEIDQSVELNGTLWIPEETGIWKLKYAWEPEIRDFAYGTGAWGWGVYGSSTTDLALPISTNEPVFKVSSVLADGSPLIVTYSFEDLRATPESFLWLQDTQEIFIHTESGKAPIYDYTTIELGVTKGFSNYAQYFGNLYYDARLKSIPSITTNRDSLFKGIISFEGGSATLINTDGYFDSFGPELYGASCRILFGGDDLDIDEYESIYTGYVESYAITDSQITISFKDNRKLLATKPNPVFDTTSYPDIEDEFVGSPVPLTYGKIHKGVATCTNGAESPAPITFAFKCADTTHYVLKSIDQVYVDNKPVAFSGVDLINGTFLLSSSVFEPGDDVSVDMYGYVADYVNEIDNDTDLAAFHGYPSMTAASLNENGYWSVPISTDTEFLMSNSYSITGGDTYTEVVSVEHNGTLDSFNFTFFTNNGHNYVPATIVRLSDTEVLAYATYVSDLSDTFIRAVDIRSIVGTTTKIGIKNAMLAELDEYKPYVPFDGVIVNPITIIESMLINYTAVSYRDLFFNIEKWERARNYYNQAIGVWYGGEKRELIDMIGDITASIFGLFVVEGEGRFSFTIRDTGADYVTEVNSDQMLGSLAKAKLLSAEYLNSARVKYNRFWASNKGTFYTNDSKEEELFVTYNSNREQEFITVLSEEEDAIALAAEAVDTFGGIFEEFTFTTKTQNIGVNVGDNIKIDARFRVSGAPRLIKGEVTAKTIDLNNFTVQLTVRFIEDLALPSNFIMTFDEQGTFEVTFDDNPDYIITA